MSQNYHQILYNNSSDVHSVSCLFYHEYPKELDDKNCEKYGEWTSKGEHSGLNIFVSLLQGRPLQQKIFAFPGYSRPFSKLSPPPLPPPHTHTHTPRESSRTTFRKKANAGCLPWMCVQSSMLPKFFRILKGSKERQFNPLYPFEKT